MDTASRHFLWLYAKSQLRLKYRHTSLGFLWNFLEPACYLTVLSLVFSVVNRMQVHDYVVFLFSALIPWRYFENVVNGAMESIVGGAWLLKKIYVSPLAFPCIRWIVASIEFLFSFIVVLLLFVFIKDTWTIHLLILPVSIMLWSIFGLGLGLICAVIFTFFRDIKPIVQMFMMFIFFSSPILFKSEMFKDHAVQSMLLRLHPMTYFASLFQKPIYYALWPSYTDWGITMGCSVTAIALGYYLEQKFKSRFYFYL